jgi:hypothetical protein
VSDLWVAFLAANPAWAEVAKEIDELRDDGVVDYEPLFAILPMVVCPNLYPPPYAHDVC